MKLANQIYRKLSGMILSCKPVLRIKHLFEKLQLHIAYFTKRSIEPKTENIIKNA